MKKQVANSVKEQLGVLNFVQSNALPSAYVMSMRGICKITTDAPNPLGSCVSAEPGCVNMLWRGRRSWYVNNLYGWLKPVLAKKKVVGAIQGYVVPTFLCVCKLRLTGLDNTNHYARENRQGPG